MNNNILVVDDEEIIVEGIKEYLQEAGYNLFTAMDGEEALDVFSNNDIDLIVLDLMMPKKDGFEVLEEIRKERSVPIIILSALKDENSQLRSYNLTATDYIVKPFSMQLLLKKIEVLLMIFYGNHAVWKYKDAVVDFSSYTATYKGEAVDVKTKDLDVLKVFLKNLNRVLSREDILASVWDDFYEAPTERTVDIYVKNLRKKLGLDCIVTVFNAGYKLTL